MPGVGLLFFEAKVDGRMNKDYVMRHMAYPQNAPGPFYSEEDGCITCGAPHVEAPELMAWYIDPSGTNQFSHCFFKRQPETPIEVEHAINAMHSSCVENLRYRGHDPAILETLCRMGYRHLCDALDESEPEESV
jgi:hypothetical protein